MDKSIKQIVYATLFVFFGGLIIFLFLIPLGYGMVIGWIFGAIISIFLLFANKKYHNFLFAKKRGKKFGNSIIWLYMFILFVVISSSLMFLLFINSLINNNELLTFSHLNDLLNPINLFTYIGGLSIVKFGIFIIGIKDFMKLKTSTKQNTKESELNDEHLN